MFNLFATYINSAEDYLQFYTDLFTLRCYYQKSDSEQSCIFTLFKDDIKSDILEQSTQKKMKEEKSLGLLGGKYPINSFELEYTLLYFR